MDLQAVSSVVQLMTPALQKGGYTEFSLGEGESARRAFKNDRFAVTVDYLADKQQLVLLRSDVVDGKPSDTWATASAWLFTEKSTERDLRSVAGDFSDTVLELAGVKAALPGSAVAAAPAKAREGDDVTPEGLAQKLLAVYPSLKDVYAAEVADKGEFLYVDFFERFAVPCVRETLQKNDRKKCEKLFDMFNNVYVWGTADTRAALTMIIIAGAVGEDQDLRAVADSYVAKYTYLNLIMPPVYKQAAKAARKAAR